MQKPAYYNEFDSNAAAWLRELIKAELIAPGDVDERSIVDVKASDLKGYSQHHFFAGSVGGRMRYDYRNGQTINQYGQQACHVNHFQPQVNN